MKKILLGFGVVIMSLLVFGILAISAEETTTSQVIEEVSTGEVSSKVAEYVGEFVKKKGIKTEEIRNIEEVDFDDLPKEVNIENVGDHNLDIFEIDYIEGGEEKQVYMITYAVEELKSQGDLIIAHDKRQFLNFGFSGEMEDSKFLKTATGVEGSLEKGYVMMREGSITGVSTNLEVVEGGEGWIEIIVYNNGEAIGFGNTFDTSFRGVKKDYDVQSKDTVTFEPGDVLSVYISAQGEVVWKDIITMVEITTIG